MNPVLLFSILALLSAAATLKLTDRGLVRLLGLASLMLAVPAVAFMSTWFDWRVELGAHPSAMGYTLVSLAGVGAIFMMAVCLSAILRLVLAGVNALRGKPTLFVKVNVKLDKV